MAYKYVNIKARYLIGAYLTNTPIASLLDALAVVEASDALRQGVLFQGYGNGTEGLGSSKDSSLGTKLDSSLDSSLGYQKDSSLGCPQLSHSHTLLAKLDHHTIGCPITRSHSIPYPMLRLALTTRSPQFMLALMVVCCWLDKPQTDDATAWLLQHGIGGEQLGQGLRYARSHGMVRLIRSRPDIGRGFRAGHQ